MPSPPLPPDVRRLLDERAQARQARDFRRADELREEIAALGWEVQDSAAASSARPILAGPPTTAGRELDAPATVDTSIQVAAEDHAADLARCLRGIASHPPSGTWELVVVDNAASFAVADVLTDVPLRDAPRVIASQARLGWADARSAGLHASRGEISVLLDTSVEPVGDFIAPLVAAFDDRRVGIAGPWAVTSTNLREFEEAPPGEVDAVEAYCLAVRRDALRAVGGFDRRYRYYRNADLDFSFAVRDAGWIAVATPRLPLARHEHRGWSAVGEEERDRLSRRNFYRFLDRWRDRTDLLTHPSDR